MCRLPIIGRLFDDDDEEEVDSFVDSLEIVPLFKRLVVDVVPLVPFVAAADNKPDDALCTIGNIFNKFERSCCSFVNS